MQNRSFDVVVLGAGIVGCMVARSLARYNLSIALVDRANDVGVGASSANSAILHSGHDPAPGSNKAALNRRGNELWRHLVEELEIGHSWCGAMVVAVGEEERRQLGTLMRRGRQNGIEGLRILGREETLHREPLLTPGVEGALWTPTAGVIDPFGATIAVAENAVENGVRLILDADVHDAIVEHGRLAGVCSAKGDIYGRIFVNSLGVHADDFMHLVGDRPEFHITPRRGEYFIFDPDRVQVKNVLFPMPSTKGKGILVSTTAHGNTFVGPDAQEIRGKDDTATTREGMREILDGARRLVPGLDQRDVIASFSGIRATGNYNRDFLIETSGSVQGLINIAGIESPGFVAAPAIAERVEQLLRQSGVALEARWDWTSRRRAQPSFKELSHQQRARLIRKEPSYGRIVCRCETVTEGEIVAAIRSSIPATSYDAIKRRCWLGTGRCQGGFDYPRVIRILARELRLPMTAVTKKGAGSEFLYRATKAVDNEADAQCKPIHDTTS
ncbi:MAG: FAD/NAD(P)-binding oxidoreductase [Spirochaetaceae bacterium]|nr:MAG: FAD/NAD(P)-binding oxidoreductase [Spirochaetaceae bacterium]